MLGLHSRWDSTRKDENESVKGIFVSSFIFRPVLILSRRSRRHVGKSAQSQRKWECLVINDSRTRVWMSTFVRTSSGSHLAKSSTSTWDENVNQALKIPPIYVTYFSSTYLKISGIFRMYYLHSVSIPSLVGPLIFPIYTQSDVLF